MELKKKYALISQPMGTRTAVQVRLERKELKEYLESMGYEILDNVFTDLIPDNIANPDIYYLSKAVELMTKADIVVFMGQWNTSCGCNIEMNICKAYNIKWYEWDVDKSIIK